MVQHQIQDHAQPALVGRIQETLEVLQGSIFRSHVCVIGDIVAYIKLGGWKVRGKPDGIDAKVGMVQRPERVTLLGKDKARFEAEIAKVEESWLEMSSELEEAEKA